MSKNLLQDMVKTKSLKKEIPKYQDIPKLFKVDEFEKQSKRGSRHGLWLVAIISIIFFIFALSFLFAKAEITINPKNSDFTLNEKLSATKDSNTEDLSFDLVIVSGEETKIIQTTEEKEVAQKARGKVRIFNNFSSVSQKLSVDTKLEGSNGKIYKTETSVTVPGKDIDDTPGSVEVGIYAAEAGEEYNSTPLDFKIAGFKGTPKYLQFDVKSVANGAITGGFIGKSPVISEEEQTSSIGELKTALQTKLFKKITDQIPSGFILFKDAVLLNTDDNSTIDLASYKANTLPINLKGTLYGFLFNEKNLTKKIAENNISNYDGSEVYIPNIRDLTFALSSEAVLFSDVQNINFNLSGNAKIVWKFDDVKLSTELLGKSKKDFNQILAQYPNVESADLVVSPFWVRTLPDKLKDIKIIVNYLK